MTKYDFIPYWEHYVSQSDIIDLYRQMDRQLVKENTGKCVRCGEETLYLNRDWRGFRCFNPACNDHGDVVRLIQRCQDYGFPMAFGILDEGRWTEWWSKEELDQFGAVRDCMTAATIFFASQYPAEYLRSRGIDERIGGNYLIGANRNDKTKKTILRNYLEQQGFSLETIRLAGLLDRYDQDYFRDHIIIPYRQYGQVYEFVGRYVGDDPRYQETKYFRMRGADKGRLIVGRGYFNWNPNNEEIICVEGEFDALSLVQNKFPYAVATRGTNGLDPKWLDGTNIKRVFMCFDSDQAGRESALKTAYGCADAGAEVRIIQLPDDLDPNDYFLKNHTADDFKALMGQAKSPEDWEIDSVPDEWEITAKVDALQTVTYRAASKPLMVRHALIKKISEKTGLKEKQIAAQIEDLAKQQQAESKTILNMDKYEFVHPALHLTKDGITLITVPMLTTGDATGQTSLEAYVITSKKEMFPLTHAALNERKWYCKRISFPTKPRYSQGVINAYLNGNAHGDLLGTYAEVRGIYREFLDFSDPNTYDYLAAWTIGTYFFRSFDHYGYIHFSGTKEVGKSKAMRVMSHLCFNGIMAVSITDASQFRLITDLLPTLFLDESENLDDKTNLERRALLLGGYEKGSGVWRTDRVGEDFRAQEYENFSPRVFASIKNMEHVRASRTVTIEMRRSFDDKIKNTPVKLSDPRFQDIRDSLFLLAMEYGHQIKKIYDEIQKPHDAEIEAREWDIFKPIVTIGTAVGSSDVVRTLSDFAIARYREKLTTYNETSPENVILQVLLEIVQEEKLYSVEAGVSSISRLNSLNLLGFLNTL